MQSVKSSSVDENKDEKPITSLRASRSSQGLLNTPKPYRQGGGRVGTRSVARYRAYAPPLRLVRDCFKLLISCDIFAELQLSRSHNNRFQFSAKPKTISMRNANVVKVSRQLRTKKKRENLIFYPLPILTQYKENQRKLTCKSKVQKTKQIPQL